MIFVKEGSVCPSDSYLITEQEKELFKLLLVEAKGNLKAYSLQEEEGII